jgi:hypothetical protein
MSHSHPQFIQKHTSSTHFSITSTHEELKDVTHTLASSIVLSELYAILHGSAKSSIALLQSMQTTFASCTTTTQAHESTAALHSLHCLPIGKRIQFKLATMRFDRSTIPTFDVSLIPPYECSKVQRLNKITDRLLDDTIRFNNQIVFRILRF